MALSGLLAFIPILIYLAIIFTIVLIIYKWVSKFISLKEEHNALLREIISKMGKGNYLSILVMAILLGGCASARISFDTLAPSPVYIPSAIKSVAVINRTVPENSTLNRLESVISGEGEGEDLAYAQMVLEGLTDQFNRSGRFSAVLSNKMLPGSGIGGILPSPLPWETVVDICNESETDALIAIESYDSDFIVSANSLVRV